MRYYEILEYMTKSGQEIDFKYDDDSEGDNNRGWQIYRIDAFVNSEHAGYLKISNIPRERFERYYPTVLNYMSMISGHSILPIDKKHFHYKDLNDEELSRTIQHLSYHSRKYYDLWNSGGEGIPETRAEKLDIIEYIIKNELERHHKQFKDFEEYHVDNPFVDYIQVFDSNTINKNRIGDSSPKDFKRQGIGMALYLEGAKYLKEKGLMLRASGTQSNEAQAIWKYMENKGLVKKIGKYTYIDPSKV